MKKKMVLTTPVFLHEIPSTGTRVRPHTHMTSLCKNAKN